MTYFGVMRAVRQPSGGDVHINDVREGEEALTSSVSVEYFKQQADARDNSQVQFKI